MSDQRVRAPIVRIVDHSDTTTILGPRGARTFHGDSAGLVRAVLEIHARPVTRAELMTELAARAGAPVADAIVDDTLAVLVADGVLLDADPSPIARPAFAPRRVVLAISGAVAAIDAPQLVRGLHALHADVRIALTRAAKQFVSIAALKALTHHQVWTSLWQRDADVPVPHVNLAEWAELVIVAPASATTLARIATGDCSDLVSAIVTATRAPVIVVPSMNDAMYASPAVQHNLDTLRDHGRWVVHPAMGVEVAHRPDERRSLLGPAPPAHAILDIVRHLLASHAPRLPADAAGWERLWSATPTAQLPWHTDDVDVPLAAALDRLAAPSTTAPSTDAPSTTAPSTTAPSTGASSTTAPSTTGAPSTGAPSTGAPSTTAPSTTTAPPTDASSAGAPSTTALTTGRRLLDLGTGAGTVAIAAARRGYRVTATDVSPTALGRARDRARDLPILFALDDVLAMRVDGVFDVVVDCGLLHCLEREQRAAYAAAVAARVGGSLLIAAHAPGGELATTSVTDVELRALFPRLALHAATPTTISGRAAILYELR